MPSHVHAAPRPVSLAEIYPRRGGGGAAATRRRVARRGGTATRRYLRGFTTLEKDAFMREEVVRAIACDADYFVGDHVEASSPADVSFWPAHPTIERLLQYKHLVSPFTDTAWNATGNHVGWTGLCKWATPFSQDVACAGHNEDDLTSFRVHSSTASNSSFDARRLSNREVLDRQTTDGTALLSYVYDDFNWTHCGGLMDAR